MEYLIRLIAELMSTHGGKSMSYEMKPDSYLTVVAKNVEKRAKTPLRNSRSLKDSSPSMTWDEPDDEPKDKKWESSQKELQR